jgi:hypothetical protein
LLALYGGVVAASSELQIAALGARPGAMVPRPAHEYIHRARGVIAGDSGSLHWSRMKPRAAALPGRADRGARALETRRQPRSEIRDAIHNERAAATGQVEWTRRESVPRRRTSRSAGPATTTRAPGPARGRLDGPALSEMTARPAQAWLDWRRVTGSRTAGFEYSSQAGTRADLTAIG